MSSNVFLTVVVPKNGDVWAQFITKRRNESPVAAKLREILRKSKRVKVIGFLQVSREKTVEMVEIVGRKKVFRQKCAQPTGVHYAVLLVRGLSLKDAKALNELANNKVLPVAPA